MTAKKTSQNNIPNVQNPSNPNLKQAKNRLTNQNNLKKVWPSPMYTKLVKKI